MITLAHRGNPSGLPENTVEALSASLEQGFDGVEFDVRRCQTGELILMHDADLSRTTNGQGKVGDQSLTYIKSLTIDRRYKVPTLKETIARLPSSAFLNIEVKDSDPTVIEDIAKLIPESRRNTVMISSKKVPALSDKTSGFKLAVIHPLASVAKRRAKRLGYKAIATRNWLINRWWLRRAVTAGLVLYLYPVNNEREVKRLAAEGITAIISDSTSVIK